MQNNQEITADTQMNLRKHPTNITRQQHCSHGHRFGRNHYSRCNASVWEPSCAVVSLGVWRACLHLKAPPRPFPALAVLGLPPGIHRPASLPVAHQRRSGAMCRRQCTAIASQDRPFAAGESTDSGAAPASFNPRPRRILLQCEEVDCGTVSTVMQRCSPLLHFRHACDPG